MAAILEEITEFKTLPPSTPRQVTFEEYLACECESGYHEWIDGEIVTMPNPSMLHQQIVGFLYVLLNGYNEHHELGVVLQAPFAMKLEALNRGREPDILFVMQERAHLFAKNYLAGAADLAIQVISPGTGRTDRGEKYYEYEAVGIKEYWLLDPDRQQAEFYRLGADHLYHPVGVSSDGIFHSEVLMGFGLRIQWLWQRPKGIDALRELGVI
jgi:Uma2 family endonuclease